LLFLEKRFLRTGPDSHMPGNDMPPPPAPGASTREERLAAKLRENLHRRKAQARAQGGQGDEQGE
jgi:hypothetical protein